MERKHSFFNQGGTWLDQIITHLRFSQAIKFVLPGARVLDFGCGLSADFLRQVENKISSGIGLDLFVDRSYETAKIKLLEKDLSFDLPFGNDEFDAVVSLANLEHLDDPEKAFKEIKRVLKPGGTLILTAPTIYAKPVLEFLAFSLGLIDKQEVSDHKRYFNKQVLEKYCQEAGFFSCQHFYFELWMNNFLWAKK